MRVDDCPTREKTCYTFSMPSGSKEFLNVNGPLQIGGVSVDLRSLKPFMGWTNSPNSKHFSGCIANLSLNGEVIYQKQI